MKKQQLTSTILAGLFSLGFVSMADAALIPRLGGLAVYDTLQDITWLANANAAAGSVYETNPAQPGQMTWDNTTAWLASLSVGGFTDWRLPTTADPDPSCTDDIAGTVPSSDPMGLNCTGSEMGHLYYIGLGATANTLLTLTGNPTELAKFTNIENRDYWSGTDFPVDPFNPDSAWSFNTAHGSQGASSRSTGSIFAWAVRSGDVSAVPVPGALWLFGSGLIGLIGVARRNSA